MLALIYLETVIPSYALGTSGKTVYVHNMGGRNNEPGKDNKLPDAAQPHMAAPVKTQAAVKGTADIGGPTQPESQAFHSVNNNNMVDLFSGDFNYNIPLLDVGGYPVAIGYSSGISMDQEASWVGLGWNINPGTITRNMRGLPDDFNGTDSIKKTASIQENKTIGVTAGADVEISGLPIGLNFSLGVLQNSYRGWGLESGVSASLNAAAGAAGVLNAGLSITNSSQDGLTLSPSISYSFADKETRQNGGFGGNISTGLSYNSRAGMKALQFSAGIKQYVASEKDASQTKAAADKAPPSLMSLGEPIGSLSVFSGGISFAHPAFTPTINLPYTSYMFTVTLKTGGEIKFIHPSLSISGYVSKQYIAEKDKIMYLPAFGYLNYQNGAKNPGALLDYNREKEIPYREKPTLPNIAIPSYTYDVFSMSGEGTGGTFRAYRSDIGYVYDHHMKTKDLSGGASVDFGGGDLTHAGVDLNFTYANNESGPWRSKNPLGKTIAFTSSDQNYEAVYFRNPGEKTINTRSFYDAIGGDYVVTPKLLQVGDNSSLITTTNHLTKYADGVTKGDILLTPASAIKQTRDKRTQLITSLNADEAGQVGLSKFIESYKLNTYPLYNCENNFSDDELNGPGTGILGSYYKGTFHEGGKIFERVDPVIRFTNKTELNTPPPPSGIPALSESFAIEWNGLIKAPKSGKYTFYTKSDDGSKLLLEDILLIDHLKDPQTPTEWAANQPVYLEKDHFYKIKVEYAQWGADVYMDFMWEYDGQAKQTVPTQYLYQFPKKDIYSNKENTIFKEKRVNRFRKSNHLSEISVLNNDGKRYIYGIPVYNLKQKEVSFSVRHENGNAESGMTKYLSRLDVGHSNDAEDSTTNMSGNDRYFSSEETPAYAHSFLLTGVVSPDYVDVTGDGISDDDLGDAVKFNYTKIAGVDNPYEWRTPYSDSASFNEGLKTDTRDDKASYVYGQKELWYLNSIESKNMIATFKLVPRKDLVPINERGIKDTGYHVAQRLEEINLYTKADFLMHGASATPVKTVHFDYSYELCKGINAPGDNTGKLTLKRIWFTYNGNNKTRKNPYIFKYHPNNPDYTTKSYDRWGNYKEASQNPGATSTNKITNAEYPYALQDSAKAAYNVAAWTLDTIILPSGGRMTMTYESDDYAYVQNRRATQMMQIAGFSATEPGSVGSLTNKLYGSNDYLYVGIKVPSPVTSKEEVYHKYLQGIDTTMFFRLNVKMPADKFGNGYEYVSCYGRPVKGAYGFINGNTIWIKLQGIDGKGNTGGSLSPLAKAAVQFLRLNLPSKAYPGSDVGKDVDLVDGVKILFSQAANIINAFRSFDGTARNNGWAKEVDLSRTSVRLCSPNYKKYGGGLRVKRVVINDNWNKMTGKTRKESTYGTEYIYTTVKRINGKDMEISSGVAAYEPVMGGEENPWRLPIEYTEQSAALAPTNMGYVEEPLGETFFPGASVGYSKVRTRSIKTKNTRSANGYEESTFYTAYDFPIITDHSLLNDNNKKTYKPALGNLLQINAAHYLVMSQGFKVELNDMHGKPRSHAVYPETDSVHPISYTENFYHVDNVNDEFKHLNNTVLSMNPQGEIDTAAVIGKDMELMMDMRESWFTSLGISANINGDVFTFGLPPVLGWVSLIPMPQSQDNLFRSAAAAKIISRHGILDSVVAIDKGSKVVTSNLLYDGESGDVLLTAVQNEFGDSIYQFNYPAAWVYDGMSGAYKNTGFTVDSITIKGGKIVSGVLTHEQVAANLASGDEILVYARNKVSGDDCNPDVATFRSPAKVWAVDANAINGGTPEIYFMDQDGKPYSGIDVVMKTFRSGRKNISASVGAVTMLASPLKKDGTGRYNLVIDQQSKIINAAVTEYKQNWQVDDKKKAKTTCSF
ncbi:PA14 domain-containing protein [Chitinophaga sp. GbtcB8]|uniref:PA14 domain-containing protein n=1 Tax=Chitinophaga sp. GbtcB8 TaxID=2824753 RepID=UPI001C2F3950|nr:PA14 domain-containing protein [Chitinophaga sp. GbtcB8]